MVKIPLFTGLYEFQVVIAGFLNHQQYQHELPSRGELVEAGVPWAWWAQETSYFSEVK